jgi:peptidoglycan hydrolase-like protein with peptidoglycan-binding domain
MIPYQLPDSVANWKGWVKTDSGDIIGISTNKTIDATPLQSWLKDVGGYDIDIDGKFGSETQTAYDSMFDRIMAGEFDMPAPKTPAPSSTTSSPIPQVGGTGATATGSMGDGTRGTDLNMPSVDKVAPVRSPEPTRSPVPDPRSLAPTPSPMTDPRSVPSSSNTPPQRTIEPRFDPSSLANVGTKNYNIRRGSSGENVSQLQTQLQNLGYDIGTTGADGKFGKNTAAAVRQFQKDYNLQVDGIVGDQTMSALSQLKNLPVNTPSPQVGGTGATASGRIGDGTRGTNLDMRDAANMAAANKPRNISYGDTMGVTTKPSNPAPVTTKLPPVPPRTNII